MRRPIAKSEQDAIRAKVLGGYTADADDPNLQYLAEHDDEQITPANYLATLLVGYSPTWLLSLTEFEVSAMLPRCLLGFFDYQRDFVQLRAAEAEALVYKDGSLVPLHPEQEAQAWARDFVREFRHPDHHGRAYFSDD